MAHYRKIDTRIWNDAKFKALSYKAKLVAFYIFTNQYVTPFGAMKANTPGMACDIGLDLEAFKDAFDEVTAMGLVRHDTKTSFLYVPNFLKYNSPESINVVKSWGKYLEYLPESNLMQDMMANAAKYIMENMTVGFKDAIPDAFRDAYQNGLNNDIPESIPDPKNKEQKAKRKEKNNNNPVVDVLASPVDKIIMRMPLEGSQEELIFDWMIESWTETFPDIDIMQQLREVKQWFKDNPEDLQTRQSLKKFIHTWLSNRQNSPYRAQASKKGAPKPPSAPKCVAEDCKAVVIGDYCGHNFCINPEHKKIAWNK